MPPFSASSLLRPKFDIVLASAWLSKQSAFGYLSRYQQRLKQAQDKGKGPLDLNNPDEIQSKAGPFQLPVNVQVVPVYGVHNESLEDPAKEEQRGATGLYHPLAAVNAGEDSLFHTRRYNNLIAAIADGVGGWRDSGIDPSLFSRSLTAYSKHAADEMFLLHESDPVDPQEVMRKAYSRMLVDKLPIAGSSTELVLSFSLATGELRVAQLGDSGYMIFGVDSSSAGKDSQCEIIHTSTEQEHAFNTPYQMGITTSLVGSLSMSKLAGENSDRRKGDAGELGEDSEILEGGSIGYFSPTPCLLQKRQQDQGKHPALDSATNASIWSAEDRANIELTPDLIDKVFAKAAKFRFDTPNQAALYNHQLRHDNIVLAGTDGLFDNIFPDEIVAIFESALKKWQDDEGVMRKSLSAVSQGAAADGKSPLSMFYEIADRQMMETLTHNLIVKAAINYMNPNYKSPFAVKASSTGGKPDDITVVAAWVRETGVLQAQRREGLGATTAL